MLINKILNVISWQLQLPVSQQQELSTFTPYFVLENDHLKLTSPSNGVTTANSRFPRCELRQLIDGKPGVWSMTKQKNIMEAVLSITKVPKIKPIMCFAQVKSSDLHVQIVELQLRYGNLTACYKNSSGQFITEFLQKYVLGEKFQIKLIAESGKLQVYIDGIKRTTIKSKNQNCYFKIGSYIQSSVNNGEDPSSVATTLLYSLKIK